LIKMSNEIEDLEKDINLSKRMVGFLSGRIRSIYENRIMEKEERLKLLKNENKNGTC